MPVTHVGDDRPAFGRVESGRQDDVGKLRHLRCVGHHVHKEGHGSQRLLPALGAGGRESKVRPGGDQHLGGTRVLEHAIGHIVGHHAAAGHCVHHGRHVLGATAIELLAFGAGLGDVVNIGVGFRESGQWRAARALPDTAFDVNRTQQTVERINRHRGIGAARRHGHAGTHPDDGLGCGLAHGTGHAHDLRRRYQRLLFTPGWRAVLEFKVPPFHQTVSLFLDEGCRVNRLTGYKQILAVLEVTDKLAVPQAFGQQHMRNGTGQRAVGAGTDRKPLMRLGGNIG